MREVPQEGSVIMKHIAKAAIALAAMLLSGCAASVEIRAPGGVIAVARDQSAWGEVRLSAGWSRAVDGDTTITAKVEHDKATVGALGGAAIGAAWALLTR
jgi:hypothetical protein